MSLSIASGILRASSDNHARMLNTRFPGSGWSYASTRVIVPEIFTTSFFVRPRAFATLGIRSIGPSGSVSTSMRMSVVPSIAWAFAFSPGASFCARTHAITDYLCGQHGIKALVVACNTATAAAIHEVRSSRPALPLVGLEPAIKPALSATRTGHIGVIGTRGTLTSRKFGKLMASVADLAHFVVQPCDGLAHAIERSAAQPVPAAGGPVGSTETGALCERYLHAMGTFGTGPGRWECPAQNRLVTLLGR